MIKVLFLFLNCEHEYEPGSEVMMLPQVHDVILVVASVEVHVIRVEEQEGEQDYDDFRRLLATVHKVAVEYVRVLGRRKTVLGKKKSVEGANSSCALRMVKEPVQDYFIRRIRSYTIKTTSEMNPDRS